MLATIDELTTEIATIETEIGTLEAEIVTLKAEIEAIKQAILEAENGEGETGEGETEEGPTVETLADATLEEQLEAKTQELTAKETELSTKKTELENSKNKLNETTEDVKYFNAMSFAYDLTFTTADGKVAVVQFNSFDELDAGMEASLVTPEKDEIGIVAQFKGSSFYLGEVLKFNASTIEVYLVNYTKEEVEEIDFDDVVIKNSLGQVVTKTYLPTVFSIHMDGETFTVEYETIDETYTTEISTGVYATVNRTPVNFDSLNISINYGVESDFVKGEYDQSVELSKEVLSKITTYSEPVPGLESTPEMINGKTFWGGTQKLTFIAPGEYSVPLVHYVNGEVHKVLGTVKINVTAAANPKLDVTYTGGTTKFDDTKLVATAENNTVLTYEDTSLFVYDQNYSVVNENYVMKEGVTTLHVTYNPTNIRALANPTVHYGTINVTVDANGNVVPTTNPTTPKTPNTDLANYSAYYIAIAGLAVLSLVLVKRSKKVNY